jgi:uncharacterized phiE125 gp8 family phage protein
MLVEAEDYILQNVCPLSPLNINEVKDYLRLTSSDFDGQLKMLIDTVSSYAEQITGRDLLNKTYKGFLDCFPTDGCGIKITKSKLQSITSIQYYIDGTLTTFASTNYFITQSNDYSSIEPNENVTYPTTDRRKQAVEITLVAGYGSELCNIPTGLKRAMLAHLAFLYDNLGDCSGSCDDKGVPEQVLALYRPFIISELQFCVL